MSAQHTPGPWAWHGNAQNREIYLATTRGGRRYVMGFRRWGMRGAQPMFQPAERGLVQAEDLLQFEVGDQTITGLRRAKGDGSVYRLDIRGIDCADARLIAAAPELLDALEELHLKAVIGTEEERHAALNKAWAAIAKARGEA